MKSAETKIEDKAPVLQHITKWELNKIEELLVVLDEDIRHIHQSLLRLNELRSLVVKRDDVSLAKLLDDIQAESDSYTSNELKRQSIREELATALGCNLEQVTLSKLEAILPEEIEIKLAKRRTILNSLTKELKKEYSSTALLLSECARFNNLLLRSIFDLGKTGTITYSCDGRTRKQDETAFVNLKF